MEWPIRWFPRLRFLRKVASEKASRFMAPRVKALINPALVTWARESAGFATAEAAARLDIDEARLRLHPASLTPA
jgi:hypothetical protein